MLQSSTLNSVTGDLLDINKTGYEDNNMYSMYEYTPTKTCQCTNVQCTHTHTHTLPGYKQGRKSVCTDYMVIIISRARYILQAVLLNVHVINYSGFY